MSLSALNCTSCGVSNINSARFCGNCGQALAGSFPNTHGQSDAAPARPGTPGYVETSKTAGKAAVGNNSNWQEMAGLICGVISILLCGVFAAFPGLFFSWTAIANAKAAGQSTRLGTIGIILNCIGVVTTIIAVIFLIMLLLLQSSGGDYPAYNGGYYDANQFGF
jgi:hypothetical protein